MNYENLAKQMARASEQTPDTIEAFIREVATNKLEKEFPTHVVLAIVAQAAFAAHGGDSIEAKTWQTYIMYSYNEGPIEQRHLENLLYPQYAASFARNTISPDDWEFLQSRAAKLLSEHHGTSEVRNHWLSIVNGRVPFGFVVR